MKYIFMAIGLTIGVSLSEGTQAQTLNTEPNIADESDLSHSLNDELVYDETTKSKSRLAPRFIGNLRLRYENVNQDNFGVSANALTLRYRGTVESDIGFNTTLLGEVEAVGVLISDFNDGSGNRPNRPVIPDPDGVEINRLQLLSQITPDLRVTAGRQRLIFDDERFIGGLAFRQNDQTFDAVRLNAKVFEDVLIDAAYIGRTNRILGMDNPLGEFIGDSFLFNVNIPSPLGRISAFHYALDLGADVNLSNTLGPDDASVQTTGVRLIGRRHWEDWGLVWEASYAVQSDYQDSQLEYEATYWLGSVNIEYGAGNLTFRAETLGSDNGVQAFQTPLGTLHKFQGDADVFLRTPNNGLTDWSAKFDWRFGTVGPFNGVKASARYHRFEADQGGDRLGSEVDLSLSAKYNRAGFSISYADYKADSFASDTRKLFLTARYPF